MSTLWSDDFESGNALTVSYGSIIHAAVSTSAPLVGSYDAISTGTASQQYGSQFVKTGLSPAAAGDGFLYGSIEALLDHAVLQANPSFTSGDILFAVWENFFQLFYLYHGTNSVAANNHGLVLYDVNDTVLASADGVIVPGTAQTVKLVWRASTATGFVDNADGEVWVYVDGVQVIHVSGVSLGTGGVNGNQPWNKVFFNPMGRLDSLVITDNTATTPPDNDACADPTVIAAVPYTETLDLTAATEEVSDPTLTDPGDPIFQTAWWTWVADQSGPMRFEAAASAAVAAGVLTGACGAWTEVGSASGTTATVNFTAVEGTTYGFVVGGVVTATVTSTDVRLTALVPGAAFAMGYALRCSPANSLPVTDPAPTFGVWTTGNPTTTIQLIAGVHLTYLSATSSFDPLTNETTWSAVNWQATVLYRAGGVVVTSSAIVRPYPDPIVGVTSGLTQGLYRSDWGGHHRWELRGQTATHDPQADTFDADGFLEVRLDGVVLFAIADVALDRPIQGNQITVAVAAESDGDNVWLANAATYPTYEGATQVPTGPDLVFVDTFEEGLSPLWLSWHRFGGLTYDFPYWTALCGVVRSGGFSEFDTDPATGFATSEAPERSYIGIYRALSLETPEPPAETCVTAPPKAACWFPHDPNAGRINLIETGQP